MKLSKEELKKKISDLIEDNDLSIELLEDIEDSFENSNNEEQEDFKAKYEEMKTKHDDLAKRYKERFTSAVDTKEKNKKEKNDIDNDLDSDELEEQEVVDIKEIF